MLQEIKTNLFLNDQINIAMREIVKDGKFPRAVKSQDLIGLGIASNSDQAEFCRQLINDPNNKYARVLIIYRNPDEKSSSVRWFARGKGNSLGETFVSPHIEPKDSTIEVFELVSGRAVLAIYENDDQNSPIKFIDLTPHEPQIILPGQIHTVLCKSEIVEVVEFKTISPTKIFPQFARDLGLVDANNLEQNGPQIEQYLRDLHIKADIALVK
jgi:hypothetical protein